MAPEQETIRQFGAALFVRVSGDSANAHGVRAEPPAASQALPLLWGEQAGDGEADQPTVQSKPSDCGPVCFPG